MRRGLDYEAMLQGQSVQTDDIGLDEVTEDEFLENRVEDYEAYRILTDFLFQVFNNDVKSKKTLMSIISDIIDTDDEDVLDASVDWVGGRIIAFLKYTGVSDSAIEDMLDDDEDISANELLTLAELLQEKTGDDVRKFVAKALSEADEDDVAEDDVNMDWTSYSNKSECMKGKDGKHPINKRTMKCKVGYSDGKKAFWRYAKRYINNGFIKGVKNKKKTSSYVKKHMEKMRSHAHRAISNKMRVKDMTKRAKAGMSIFSGYKPRSSSSKNLG